MAKKSKRSRRTKLRRTCGAMAAHMMLLERFPSYRANQMRLEDATSRRRERRVRPKRAKIVTVKTVVNVVYKTAEQNISTAQINSQIKALNKDFRATNPDKSKTPAAWNRPRDRRAHPVQARQGDAHQDDGRRLLPIDDGGEESGDRGHCSVQPEDASEPLGLRAARQPARLRAVPRRPAEHRRRGDQLPGIRHVRHGGAAVPPRPYRDARDRPLLQSAAHLGATRRIAAGRTWCRTRRTAPVRTPACRRFRPSPATTARTATCS